MLYLRQNVKSAFTHTHSVHMQTASVPAVLKSYNPKMISYMLAV